MSGSGVAEARIKGDRKPRINLCGSCGARVSETELLCTECKHGLEPEESMAELGLGGRF